MYTVRFYIELDLLEGALDIKRFLKDWLYTSKQTEYILFVDIEDNCLWFQANLPFVPVLGTKLSNIPTAGFYWQEEALPIVVDVEYSFKQQIFFVKLDWGLDNQIDLLRDIERRTYHLYINAKNI